MTKEEILAMEPGMELDAMVAEHIFGYKNRVILYRWADRKSRKYPIIAFADGGVGIGNYDTFVNERGVKVACGKPHKVYMTPGFCTDIADAWKVVQRLSCHKIEVLKQEMVRGRVAYRVWIFTRAKEYPDECWDDLIRVECPTAPEAICKAALLAVMEV